MSSMLSVCVTDVSAASVYLVNLLSGNDEITEIYDNLVSGLHCPLNIIKCFSMIIK